SRKRGPKADTAEEVGADQRLGWIADGGGNGDERRRRRREIDDERRGDQRGPDAIAEQENGGEGDTGRRPYERDVVLPDRQQQAELAGKDIRGADEQISPDARD